MPASMLGFLVCFNSKITKDRLRKAMKMSFKMHLMFFQMNNLFDAVVKKCALSRVTSLYFAWYYSPFGIVLTFNLIWFDMMEIANLVSDLFTHFNVSVTHGVVGSSKVLLIAAFVIELPTLTTWNVFGGPLVQLWIIVALVW